MATATNETGSLILHAKICILSYSMKEGCLFEVWNTATWQPGQELTWNTLSERKLPFLKHEATIEEFEGAKPPSAPASPVTTIQTAAPDPKLARTTLPAAPVPSGAIQFSNPLHGPVLTLEDGTPLRMRLARNLSSADAQPGDRVDFEVLDEVKVNGTLVIASGAIAAATITDSEARRSMGRAGRLDVTLDYVRAVNGEKIRLRGVQDTKGGGHTGAMTGAMVATAVVFWPAAPLFLFMRGKDVKIPKGHEVTVYVNGDQPVQGLATTTAPPPVRETGRVESAPARTTAGKAMVNEDVLTLKAAAFGDDFIITKIKTSPSAFSLDTPDLVKLKQAGLSDAVIGAMVLAAADNK